MNAARGLTIVAVFLALAVFAMPAYGKTREQRARHVVTAIWPASQVSNAMRVIRCESGGTFRMGVVGDGGNSFSYWQIHLPSHPWVNREKVRWNAWYATRVALRIWKGAGWRAWTCARIHGIA